MALVKPSRNGGTFIDQKSFFGAKAILLDHVSNGEGRNPHAKGNADANRKLVTIDMAVFWNEKQLAGEEDPEIVENGVVAGGVIADRLVEHTKPGDSIICRFEQPAGKNYFSYTTYLDESVLEAVEAYYTKREEGREASMPDFLK